MTADPVSGNVARVGGLDVSIAKLVLNKAKKSNFGSMDDLIASFIRTISIETAPASQSDVVDPVAVWTVFASCNALAFIHAFGESGWEHREGQGREREQILIQK